MNHMDTAGFNISAAMTCILPMAQVVYTGDDDGRIVGLSDRVSFYLWFTDWHCSMNGIVYSGIAGVDSCAAIQEKGIGCA